MAAKEIILTTGPLGGLGDHMIYTSLPERFTQLGYDVYMDKDNTSRNGETYDLLWGMNPFVKGTSDKKPNAGYTRQGTFYDIAGKFPIGCIEAMERAHGLPPPYSIAPRIYYKPEPFHIDLRNCVLADFYTISSTIGATGINDFLQKMMYRFADMQMYLVQPPDGIVTQTLPVTGPTLQLNSIYQYVDAIASCRAWMGTEAGGQSLAAAVRGEHDMYELDARPEIVVVATPKTFNSRGYTFRGADYRVTTHGGYTGDYWEPVEVPYERYSVQCRRTVEEARTVWKTRQDERAARATANV